MEGWGVFDMVKRIPTVATMAVAATQASTMSASVTTLKQYFMAGDSDIPVTYVNETGTQSTRKQYFDAGLYVNETPVTT